MSKFSPVIVERCNENGHIRHIEKDFSWVRDCPQSSIRDNEIRHLLKAVTSGKANDEKKGVYAKEEFKFRSQKDTAQTMEINKQDYNLKGGLYNSDLNG